MSTMCAAALLRGLVDLDVIDDEVAGVETFCVCVGFRVLQETEQELGRLDGPSSFRDAELFSWWPVLVSVSQAT